MNIQEILIAAGSIGNSDLRRTDDIAYVVSGNHRLCFGPAHTETGELTEGWDATEYELQVDQAGEWWKEGNYTYVETDEEMIKLAAKYEVAD